MRAALIRRASELDAATGEGMHRALDLAGACVVATILSPVLIARAVIALTATGRIFDREMLVGRYRIPFERLRFAGSFPGRWLGALFNLARRFIVDRTATA